MSISDVYRALWRRKLIIALGTAILVASAWYFTERQTPEYTAATLVRIQQQGGGADSSVSTLQASEQLAATYGEIIDSGALYPVLADQLEGEIDSRTLGSVDISGEPVESLDLLWIQAESEQPELAAEVANAAPEALQTLVADAEGASETVNTIQPARAPSEPTSPDLVRNLVIAAVLGLVLNGAIALALEGLSDRVPELEQLEKATGHRVLGTIPTLRFAGRDALASEGGWNGRSGRPLTRDRPEEVARMPARD
jgi:capsular polysaccharide biosynthesis protein